MDMHKNFAEWYRLVSIEPKGDVLKSRWAGVETWSVSLSDDAVLETVRMFQGLPEAILAFVAACARALAALRGIESW
jgi:hypothetical protein